MEMQMKSEVSSHCWVARASTLARVVGANLVFALDRKTSFTPSRGKGEHKVRTYSGTRARVLARATLVIALLARFGNVLAQDNPELLRKDPTTAPTTQTQPATTQA